MTGSLCRSTAAGAILETVAASDTQPLDRLRSSVGQVLHILGSAAGPEHLQLTRLVDAALDAVSAVVGIVRVERRRRSDAYSAWLHDLQSPVTAMAGWAQMLRVLDDREKRQRARDAIERNARLLEKLLASPPA